MSLMGLVTLLVWLIVIGVFVWLVTYVAQQLAPSPLSRVISVVAVVVGCILVLVVLLNFIGAVNIAMPPS